MKRFAPAALLLVGSACASGASGERVVDTDVTLRGAIAGDAARDQIRLTSASGASIVAIEAGVDRVWSVLPSVYQELGLPISTTDPAQKVILTLNQRIARIDGKRLSTFFRCAGAYGNSADNGNTTVTVRTQVQAATAGSVVRIEVQAQSNETGATTAGSCGTMGALERLVASRVQERAAAAGQ
jgi:hypothetical protein